MTCRPLDNNFFFKILEFDNSFLIIRHHWSRLLQCHVLRESALYSKHRHGFMFKTKMSKKRSCQLPSDLATTTSSFFLFRENLLKILVNSTGKLGVKCQFRNWFDYIWIFETQKSFKICQELGCWPPSIQLFVLSGWYFVQFSLDQLMKILKIIHTCPQSLDTNSRYKLCMHVYSHSQLQITEQQKHHLRVGF